MATANSLGWTAAAFTLLLWFLGAFLGLMVLSLTAHHDQSSVGYWGLHAFAGIGASWLMLRMSAHPAILVFLTLFFGFLAFVAAFPVQWMVGSVQQAIDSRAAIQAFDKHWPELRYSGAEYIGGQPRTSYGATSVGFRTPDPVIKVFQTYKARLPSWHAGLATPGDWARLEIRSNTNSTEVVMIGESYEQPGKTEITFHLFPR